MPSFHIGLQDGSLGAAIHRQAPVYVTDILTDPIWTDSRQRLSPLESVLYGRGLYSTKRVIYLKFSRFIIAQRAFPILPIQSFSRMPVTLRASQSNAIWTKTDYGLNETACACYWKALTAWHHKLDMLRLVETLSTELLKVTQCDCFALLLPNAEKRAFQLTTSLGGNWTQKVGCSFDCSHAS